MYEFTSKGLGIAGPTLGFMNGGVGNIFGGYGGYGSQVQSQYGYVPQVQTPPPPPKTNKIFVTSLQDAMSRQVEANTEVVYLHQSEPLLYQIVTDMQGRKSVDTFVLSPYVAEEKKPDAEYVSRAEFEEWKAKVNGLFAKEVEDE